MIRQTQLFNLYISICFHFEEYLYHSENTLKQRREDLVLFCYSAKKSGPIQLKEELLGQNQNCIFSILHENIA